MSQTPSESGAPQPPAFAPEAVALAKAALVVRDGHLSEATAGYERRLVKDARGTHLYRAVAWVLEQAAMAPGDGSCDGMAERIAAAAAELTTRDYYFCPELFDRATELGIYLGSDDAHRYARSMLRVPYTDLDVLVCNTAVEEFELELHNRDLRRDRRFLQRPPIQQAKRRIFLVARRAPAIEGPDRTAVRRQEREGVTVTSLDAPGRDSDDGPTASLADNLPDVGPALETRALRFRVADAATRDALQAQLRARHLRDDIDARETPGADVVVAAALGALARWAELTGPIGHGLGPGQQADVVEDRHSCRVMRHIFESVRDSSRQAESFLAGINVDGDPCHDPRPAGTVLRWWDKVDKLLAEVFIACGPDGPERAGQERNL